MKRTLLFFLVCVSANLCGRTKWNNPAHADRCVITGNSFTPEANNLFTRIDPAKQADLRPDVWRLSQNSAGLSLCFVTNSPSLKIRYKVKGGFSMAHMPATGVSGVDLYSRDCNGVQSWCVPKYAFGDTVVFNYPTLEYNNIHKEGNEYTLFLPLYNTVEWLEIGSDEEADFRFEPRTLQKPIVAYGTSIAQGACASRPGMAWSNILQRKLDIPVVNLGFSGNAYLEKPVLDIIRSIDSRLIILDNLPNLIGRKELSIDSLVCSAVEQIRKTSSVPVLLVDHAGYPEQRHSKVSDQEVKRVNQQQYDAYLKLKQRYSDLYYLTKEDIALDNDATVDGVHPTDWGMVQQADAYEKSIRAILKLKEGDSQTTRACRQRREPLLYEWNERYEASLASLNTNSPEVVVIGNSILHYWNGQPAAPVVSDSVGWEKAFGTKRVLNLGCGWDRIENALWRVQHGALSGYRPKQILVKIGTNNLSVNSDEEIVNGILNLADQITLLQPEAELTVIGLLPRRNFETRIAGLNQKLRERCRAQKINYVDVGGVLVDRKSKKINESLFKDGLHPNAKGYERIGERLGKI
ncbi:MAG: SGNH/GDSL hydrolase family protein [Bacteroidales bacterium]